MSIRPSLKYRNPTPSIEPSQINYVVLGDTSLATIYATKLFQTFGSTNQIYLISNGNDLTTDVNVEALNYNILNSETINKALQNERLHLVLSNNEVIGSVNDRRDLFFEQYFNYKTGSGPLGDFISAYYTPFVGPWFTTDNQSRIETFVKNSTIQKPLTNNEMIVATNIATLLNLTMSQSIIATKPTILTLNNIFVYNQGNKLERQLFMNEYITLQSYNNVNIVNHVNSIYLENTGNSCLQNITYNTFKTPTPVTINNACLLWMDNLYDYVRLLGLSNVEHKKIAIPVFYRMVFAIPTVNSTGVNLSNLNPNEYPLNIGDGLSTRLTFCCTDVAEEGESMNLTTPQWNVTCYTCNEDLSNPDQSTYANTTDNKTLLIIEAISLNNRRVISWDDINTSTSVNLNPTSVELGRYNAFMLIASNIYMAYTGVAPDLSAVTNGTICNGNGICIDSFPINHSSRRESPLISVTRMLGTLFGGTSYPVPYNNSQGSCCG